MKRLRILKNHLSADLEVCIVAMGRSPTDRSGGSLKDIPAYMLAGDTIKGILDRYSICPKSLEEFYIGNVQGSNLGQSLGKQTAVHAGLCDSISCTTVNKLCASGMKAVMLGCLAILNGSSQCVLAGGVESMSNYPYLLSLRNGVQSKVKDAFNWDTFPDAVTREAPILIADMLSKELQLSRKELDEYAVRSCDKAMEADKCKKFENEIIPITNQRTKKTISRDYLKSGKGVEGLRAIYKDGSTTSGNACGTNDGASFIVLASRAKAVKENWKILATIVSFADAEQNSRRFPISPALAIPKALKQVNLDLTAIDFMELNEAFASVVLGNSKILNYPVEKINVYGGALSLGHALGSSGCRIIVTLISTLLQEKGKYGVAGICNGGGGASAVVIRRDN